MARQVTVVVDGMYGGCGKGNLVSHIANEYSVHVRTGGPQAGHAHMVGGKKFTNRSIPVGWVNKSAMLVIGAGALIHIPTLLDELDRCMEYDPTVCERLYIDSRAMVIEDKHIAAESSKELGLVGRISSTGRGVGAARIARIKRDPNGIRTIKQVCDEDSPHSAKGIPLSTLLYTDTAMLLNACVDAGHSVLLEGHQGHGLSLWHGYWPYVTSADTSAAAMCSEAGISPLLIDGVIMVLRTYPIRTGGPSGPMYQEITWDEISRRCGKEVKEMTSVTNRVRRVGEWDWDLVKDAAMINRPTALCVNFVDYLSARNEGVKNAFELTQSTRRFLDKVERELGAPVWWIGTGGPDLTVIDKRMLYQGMIHE